MLCSKQSALALALTATFVAVPIVSVAAPPATAKPPVAITANKPVADDGQKLDVIETATKAGTFKTLATALKAAGLVETLKGKGPFTILAPTDEAFAKLPAGTVESLLKPENKEKLTAILTYHVIPGQLLASEISKQSSAKTVNGDMLRIEAAGDEVKVNNAKVTKTDIHCTNGVIHVIDTVLMPKN